MVGAEGTLGVITELTLKLHGIPEAIAGGVCPFASVEDACNAAIATIQSGIPIARVELLDALQVKATNLYSKLDLPETPMLFVEFHGSPAGVAEQSERFGEIAARFRRRRRSNGRPSLRIAPGSGRRGTTPIGRDWGLRPGAQAVATDVCVPLSRLAECVTETQRDIAEQRLVAPIVWAMSATVTSTSRCWWISTDADGG